MRRSAVRLLGLAVGDERPGALLRLDDPADLHLPVGPRDRVQVHGEIDRELPHRGELRPRLQAPVGHGEEDLVDDLPVERHAGSRIEAERAALAMPSNVLVH